MGLSPRSGVASVGAFRGKMALEADRGICWAGLVSLPMEPSEVLVQLDRLSPSVLLEHFAASRRQRADAIREFWTQPDGRSLAENLIELEINDDTRSVVISLLKEREEVGT